MRNVLRAVPVFAAAAMLMTLGPAPRAAASDCDDPEDGEPAYGVWIEGFVRSVSGPQVQVGNTTLVLDPPPAPSWDDVDEGPDEIQSPRAMRRVISRLQPGDGIYADGVLAADGTIRLRSIDVDPDIAAGSEPVTGRITAIGDHTLDVGGQTVTIEGGGDFMTRYDWYADFSELRVGDLVCIPAIRAEDGTLAGSEGTYRMSGAGTEVRGTIDATDFSDEPRVQVGGVWCVLDGHEAITGLGGGPCAYGGEDMKTGWTVQVRGVLRDGDVIADLVHVVSRGQAKRRGAIRGSGFVNAAEARRVVVNGLGIRKPGRSDATPSARAGRPGQRVRFAARASRSGTGDVVATSISRR